MKQPHLFFLVATIVSTSMASDWPQWRGPNSDGISGEVIPVELPDSLPVVWKADVGIGFSTVAVSGNRVLTMGNRDETDTVWCFDAESGAVIWRHSYNCPLDPLYYEGGPSATPTIHGNAVYTLSKKGHVFRLELSTGKVIWDRDLVVDHEVELPEWSFASSPFIHGDLVVLNVGRGGIALNRETGKTLWVPNLETSGYATVVPFPAGTKDDDHLLFSAKALIGFNIDSGVEGWNYPSRSSRDVNAADPVVRGNQIVLSSSAGTVKLEVEPDANEPRVIWEQKDLKWYFNPGVLIKNHLYSLHGTTHRPTELTCTDFETGETVWSEGGFGSGGLMAAGETILLFDQGTLTLFDPSPEGFSPRLQQKVLEGKCWTAPVLANGKIYVRNAGGDLACLELGADRSP
ncbi:MAG: PQQ-binding-like beta-propeller repeat protein [Verrucomicrobiota bacterium]